MISRYAAVAAIVFIYIALRIPGLDVPLDRDEGAFGHMGQMIRQGGLPYRDGLDHKPPVAFYINALALEFVPATARGVHAFLLVYNLLTLVCLFWVARVYFESFEAGLWCAFCYAVVSASPSIQGFTASTEMWALLPISVSLLCAVLGVRKHSARLLVLSGAAGAVACWTKQTMAASILFVVIYVAVAARRRVVWWIAGAAGASAAIVLYFAAHGLVHEFMYWCFTYGVVYAKQTSFSDTLEDLRDALGQVGLSNLVILAVGISVVVWALVRKKMWAVFVVGFLVLSLAGTIPGFAYQHYFAQLAPAIALAGGQGLRVLLERRGRVLGIACAAAVLGSSILADRDYFFERDPNVISRNFFEDNPFPESRPVADYVAAHTSAADRVLIVGSEPQILFYANRRGPSAFLMLYPLMTVHARYAEFQSRMEAEVKAHPPKYILAMMNIPTSLTVDEGLEPEILKYLTRLEERDYTLERVRIVGGSDGEWVEPGDRRLTGETPFVAVYRRK